MSFEEALSWSVLRSVAAAALAIPISVWLSEIIRQSGDSSRFWWLLLVLCPLFAPDLIVGYSYRSFELSLLHRPDLNHGFYFVLALLKYAPAAVVVRLCSPPDPLSDTALHCLRLMDETRRVSMLERAVRWKARLQKHLGGFGIVFLLMMQEFEIASLLQIPAWTVHLFDAQAGGLMPLATMRRLVLPVLIQLVVILPLMWSVHAAICETRPRWRTGDDSLIRKRRPGILTAVVAAVLLWGMPLSLVTASGVSGVAGVLRNGILIRSTMLDLTASMAVGAPCAVLSLIVGRRLCRIVNEGRTPRDGGSRRFSLAGVTIGLLPGLMGALVVSLAVLLAVQHPALTGLRTSVWPMATALIVFLVPRAFLLMLLLPGFRDSEASRLATLLEASTDPSQRRNAMTLKWWYEIRPLFLVGVLLFYWSLSNLTAAALLCPPTIPLLSFSGSIVPLPVRLYKFIHQGRTAALSVMALLSVLVPFVMMLCAGWSGPWLYDRLSRSGDGRS